MLLSNIPKKIFFFLLLLPATLNAQFKTLFNNDWQFIPDMQKRFSAADIETGNIPWENISLPHTAFYEPIEKTTTHWQGVCHYRKTFFIPAGHEGKHIALQFDAAMQEAQVFVNGKHLTTHQGGYLPFYVDISEAVYFGKKNDVVVRLSNEDNPVIPPGKPLKDLDFNYYSGIYRDVWLITKEKTHFSDPMAANRKAGGGIFISYSNISEQLATMRLQADVQNNDAVAKNIQVAISVSDQKGRSITRVVSENETITAGTFKTVVQTVALPHPQLWSPDTPYLYQVTAELISNGKVIDAARIQTGVRSIRFEAGAFYLNNRKTAIRGTNRHQEYPYLGNALSNNAQFRDAWKIKAAGFNFVRSSHYPQSPAFLDACDELGILVMDAIPGWQFFGNETFQENSLQTVREMVRRDRNHPSVVLWEPSLNESRMSKTYMQRAHAIVHEEFPFEPVYTAGWVDEVFDVFIPARQHAKAPDYWKKYNKPKPILIAEYGDWEYYAGNAGFNQKEYQHLKKEEKSSRQLRGQGQKRLLQQALNYQESHNDNLFGPAVGDANWLMFDYKRGYAPDIESSGIIDMMRLPKFAFYFYQSQQHPAPSANTPFRAPMLFIANYWQEPTDTVITIFSNCEEVELFLNGKSLGKQLPDNNQFSTRLPHPPFTFRVAEFTPGTLKAIGYIQQKKVAQHEQRSTGAAASLALQADYSGKKLKANTNDVVFIYAHIRDQKGTTLSQANNAIRFEVSGNASIVGPATVAAEAGIATLLVKAGDKKGRIKITAHADQLPSKKITIYSE